MIAVFTTILLVALAAVVLVPAGGAWLWWSRRHNRRTAAPMALVAIPLLAVGLKFLALPPLVNWSRERAMDNAAPMIAAIEAYRQRTNRYPMSLLSVHADYDTGVVGIPRYYYEPSGDAYNLVFEQPSDVLGTQEFVIYNPRGEQNFSAHDSDLLEFSQADINRQRGYYAVRDAGRPNWKRFLFD